MGRDGPLWVSSGHEKAIETQRGTKDRGHLGHTHACSWFVPRSGVRSDSPEAGWGARGNVCQAQGRSGQPLSSGCLLPAVSWRTVRGDRPGWTRGPPSTSLTEGAWPCVSEIPWPEVGGSCLAPSPAGRRPRPHPGSYFCSFRLWFPSVRSHLRHESDVSAVRGCDRPHDGRAW